MTFSRLDHKLKRELADTIVGQNGIIFGGFVRDAILHDHFASEYYSLDDDMTVLRERYSDPAFHPELMQRTKIPKDIDCFFESPADFDSFMKQLPSKNFIIRRVRSRDPKQYFENLNVEYGDLQHYIILISTRNAMLHVFDALAANLPSSVINDVKHLLKSVKIPSFGRIKIDAMVVSLNCTTKPLPPFNSLDFECNGLIMTKEGIALSHELSKNLTMYDRFKRMSGIINDIIARKASCAYLSPQPYRIRQMAQKEWTIVGAAITQHAPEDDDTCIICTEIFSRRRGPCMKLKCCSALYHPKCLQQATTNQNVGMNYTGSCIHCRRETNVDDDSEVIDEIATWERTPRPAALAIPEVPQEDADIVLDAAPATHPEMAIPIPL